MRVFFLFVIIVTCPGSAIAALPFVTDDAGTQNPNQFALETFAERWSEPTKAEVNKDKTNLYSYFISGSYGLTKHLEMTMAGNAGYDIKDQSTSFMNPIFQLKTKISDSQNSGIPGFAIDWGYVDKHGKGEYYDPATNYYAIAVATSKFLNDKLIIHLNYGKKASYNIPHNHFYRDHLGIGLDIALIKKIRLVVESYNGAPNSPRDSPNYFHSYQSGLKWIYSDKISPYIIYGFQPTFTGYNDNGTMVYRRTSWIQVGARIVFN